MLDRARREPSGIGDAPDGYAQIATPGYFETMRIRVSRGRLFTERDRGDSPPVAVINETMARTYWDGEDPVGKRFRTFDDRWPFIEVIGVIPDVKESRLDQDAEARFYTPYAQAAINSSFAPLGMYVTLKVEGGAWRGSDGGVAIGVAGKRGADGGWRLVGVPIGIALTRAAGSFVFGVPLLDVPTIVAVLAVLWLAALAAAAVPAIRASRIEPVVALRGD